MSSHEDKEMCRLGCEREPAEMVPHVEPRYMGAWQKSLGKNARPRSKILGQRGSYNSAKEASFSPATCHDLRTPTTDSKTFNPETFNGRGTQVLRGRYHEVGPQRPTLSSLSKTVVLSSDPKKLSLEIASFPADTRGPARQVTIQNPEDLRQSSRSEALRLIFGMAKWLEQS
ncbi:Tyrosine--tRNA ligase [Psidium guajava]|nr:Tyrosine--tRNA ligase [Psidium guajava]